MFPARIAVTLAVTLPVNFALAVALARCTGEPATYLEECVSDSACAAPLQCLVPTDEATARCSIACDDDDACGELTGSACYPCEGGVCAASECT